jgi:arabinofuranosyltransferase
MSAAKDSAVPPSWKRSVSIVGIIFVCFATYVTWRLLNRPTTGIDDADIFLVYARNFVHGHGLVYNVGGEHVEGFSSFLFFLVCSAAYAVSPSPEVILFVVNLLFVILTTLCILSVLSSLSERFATPSETYILFCAAYLIWIGANPLYFAWNVVALMDNGLYSLIVIASFALLAKLILRAQSPTSTQTLGLSILIGLTVLVRPEGMLWAPLEFVALAWICFTQCSTRREALTLLRFPIASIILTPAALILFRIAYFGYPLPNTYYAKVTASLYRTVGHGLRYFGFFVHLYGKTIFIPLLIATAWIIYTLLQRPQRTTVFRFTVLATVFCLAAYIVPILEGGEHFASFRMYQAVWPILFFSLILPLALFARRLRFAYQFGYVAVFVLLIGATNHCTWKSFAINNRPNVDPQNDHMMLELAFRLARDERMNALRLRQLFGDTLPTTGVAAAGGFAYGYQGTVYDLLGLNDVRMAHADRIKTGPWDHQSFNNGVFFQELPDILLPIALPAVTASSLESRAAYYSDPGSWDNVIFKDIFNDPRFKSTYTPAILADDRHPGILCFGYFKNTYLHSFASDKAIHVTLMPSHT